MALKHGYSLIHPNCRHEFIPYYEEMQTEEDLKKDREYSNRKFIDSRPDKERQAYAKWQQFYRQLNTERLEYEEMKVTLGKDMPYSNLGSFRRAVRQENKPDSIMQYRKRKIDATQYERWTNILGKENMPQSLEKFQDMKYNNIENFGKLEKEKEEAYLYLEYNDVLSKIGHLSNDKARKWYNSKVKSIPNIINKNLELKEQAIEACNLRNKFRTETRELMSNEYDRDTLEKDFSNKSFEELMLHKKDKYGLIEEEAYISIIKSAQKTNKKVNKKYGLEEDDINV